MNEARSFAAPGIDLEELAEALMTWWESERLEVQRFQLGHRDGVLIQVRSKTRSWLAESLEWITPFKVDLRTTPNGYLNVNIATSKWSRLHLFASFDAEAALFHLGGWSGFAYKWRGRTFDFIEQYVSARAAAGKTRDSCPSCRATVSNTANFCDRCGQRLSGT